MDERARPSAIPWTFLSDEAVETGAQDRFGTHSAYANVIYSIAKSCKTPFAVALYSSWGTGKTSICKIVHQLTRSDPSMFYVYLDVWKYSSDPLKRWILFETLRSLQAQKAFENYDFDGRSLQSHLEFEESWQDRDQVKVNFDAIQWIVYLTAVVLGLFVLFLILGKSNYKWQVGTTVTGILSAAGLTALFFEGILKELFKSVSGLVLERSVRHVSAKPAFSSEKFGEIFRDMVGKAVAGSGSAAKRIIFVFDNLDRSTEEVAVEAIGVIKTYLDVPGCVYIIPCDEAALMKHITKSYISTGNAESNSRYAKEFLNKFFQTTLRLPLTPDFDIENFLDEQLKAAGMTDLPADARDVLVLGYLGQTPRQIKRVLNDLISYRALALQAEAEGLVASGELTSDISLLTKMSVISVEWPDFLNRLADDPELWSDLMTRISTGGELSLSGVGPELVSFLRATRHVSAQSDIRPFIYLKRVKYQRNVALAKAVENHLRKGEAPEFISLLQKAETATEREEILRIATDLVRRWLDAEVPRDVFLRNAITLLIQAANAFTGHRHLELIVADLLQHLTGSMAVSDLAKVVPLKDLFAFNPEIPVNQKAQCLNRLADLFSPAEVSSPDRLQYWKEFLGNSALLEPDLKSRLTAYLTASYQQQEPSAIQLLFEAANRGEAASWAVSGAALSLISSRITFDNSELDKQRLFVLSKFQQATQADAKNSIVLSLTNALQGSRTRNVDPTARAAMDFVAALDARLIPAASLTKLASVLIEQWNGHSSYPDKAPWLAPLIYLYRGLAPEVQKSVDGLYLPYLTDSGGDINGLLQFLTILGPNACIRMLQIPGTIKAMHDQPARLEARFGATTGPQYREQILAKFPATIVLVTLKIFDEARPWDLALFGKTLERGKQEKIAEQSLRKLLEAFVSEFLLGKTIRNALAYDAILATCKQQLADIIDESLARSLAACCLEVIGMNIEKFGGDLRFLSTKLSTSNRVWLIEQITELVLKPRQAQWIQVLGFVTNEVKNDKELAQNPSIVPNLLDYGFEAARVSPAEATKIITSLVALADPRTASRTAEEAVDQLLVQEATGGQIPAMEPFLAVLSESRSLARPEIAENVMKLCLRMLGTAKSDAEHLRYLEFLAANKIAVSDEALRDRVGQLAQSANEQIAHKAKQVLESTETE